VFRVGRNAGSVPEQRLDLRDGNAMLLALRAVAAVPVNPVTRKFILAENYANVYTNVNDQMFRFMKILLLMAFM